MPVTSRAVEVQRLRADGPRWWVLLAGLRRPVVFLRRLIGRISEDRTLTLAAAMAYYFFLAIIPLLLFMVALVSVLPVQGLENWVLASLARVVPPEAFGLLELTVRDVIARPRSGLVSLGAVLALWAASTGFASVTDGLNLAYRVDESRPWWHVRLNAIGLTVALSTFMILAFVLAVFGGLLASWLGQRLGPAAVPVLLGARWVIVVTVVTAVAATIYYVCPDVEQELYWVTPGSFLFTVGFGASSAGFSYYVGRFAAFDATYGSLCAVIVLLVWMYLLAFCLLLGGHVNALLEHLSPAGKAAGQREEPPVEVQAERIVRDERTSEAARDERAQA
jgi:membrane protein